MRRKTASEPLCSETCRCGAIRCGNSRITAINSRVTSVASMLELGAGFHPEFSGRDNIHLNCSVLGMSEEEIAERFPKIVAFSELGDFIADPTATGAVEEIIELILLDGFEPLALQ